MSGQRRTLMVLLAIVAIVELTVGVISAASLAEDGSSTTTASRDPAAAPGPEPSTQPLDDADIRAANQPGPRGPLGPAGCSIELGDVKPLGNGRALHVIGDEGEDDGIEDTYDTIDAALEVAGPGDVVVVAAGTYDEEVRTQRPGTADAPITIVGPGARIDGDDVDDGRLVEIRHDHVTLAGFELTGADKLVWVEGATGVRLLCNELHDGGGECIRIKALASGNEVAWNRIEDCGQEGFNLDDDRKNGEGIYIGTSPEQLDRNPTTDPDASDGNWVHHNLISVPAECVDVKESAVGNVVEDNMCSRGQDPDGAGFSSRGSSTVFRHNRSEDHDGAGIRLGGDDEGDGIDTVVVGNELVDNQGFGLKVMREPQATICDNRVSGNDEGPVNREGYDATRPCEGDATS